LPQGRQGPCAGRRTRGTHTACSHPWALCCALPHWPRLRAPFPSAHLIFLGPRLRPCKRSAIISVGQPCELRPHARRGTSGPPRAPQRACARPPTAILPSLLGPSQLYPLWRCGLPPLVPPLAALCPQSSHRCCALDSSAPPGTTACGFRPSQASCRLAPPPSLSLCGHARLNDIYNTYTVNNPVFVTLTPRVDRSVPQIRVRRNLCLVTTTPFLSKAPKQLCAGPKCPPKSKVPARPSHLTVRQYVYVKRAVQQALRCMAPQAAAGRCARARTAGCEWGEATAVLCSHLSSRAQGCRPPWAAPPLPVPMYASVP
jgi:hypothetical protein